MTTVSEKLGWPVKVDYPSARIEDRKVFEATFLDLLKLQDLYVSSPRKICPQLMRRGPRGEQLGVPKAEGLYPIQALVHPIALRFRFHFEGQRPTNQLDKVCKSRVDPRGSLTTSWLARVVLYPHSERRA